MKNIKRFLSVFALMLSVYALSAQCTVNTPCGSFTYDVNSVSVSSSFQNGVTTVRVYSGGNLIDEFSCNGQGSISTSCSSGGGNGGGGGFDICDFVTSPTLRAFLGCD